MEQFCNLPTTICILCEAASYRSFSNQWNFCMTNHGIHFAYTPNCQILKIWLLILVFQMTLDKHSNYYSILSCFFCSHLCLHTHVSFWIMNENNSWHKCAAFCRRNSFWFRLRHVIFLLFCSTCASTCLEFVKFLSFTEQFSLIPTHPTTAWTIIHELALVISDAIGKSKNAVYNESKRHRKGHSKQKTCPKSIISPQFKRAIIQNTQMSKKSVFLQGILLQNTNHKLE